MTLRTSVSDGLSRWAPELSASEPWHGSRSFHGSKRDVLAAGLVVTGQSHDVIVIDDAGVAGVRKSAGDREHVEVTVVGRALGVAVRARDRASDIAKMDVEDAAGSAEAADAFENVLAGLVAGADAEGHAIVGRGLLTEQALEVHESAHDLRDSPKQGNRRVVAVHRDASIRRLRRG